MPHLCGVRACTQFEHGLKSSQRCFCRRQRSQAALTLFRFMVALVSVCGRVMILRLHRAALALKRIRRQCRTSCSGGPTAHYASDVLPLGQFHFCSFILSGFSVII